MAEENTNTVPSPKDAAINLLKSVRNPLIFFGLGFVTCLIWQNRRRKLPGAP